MEEVDQLEEELTCQQVMLRSLDGLGEEYEDERIEMRADIARLKRMLDKARRNEPTLEDEDYGPIGSQTPRQELLRPDRATPGPASDNRQQTPSPGPSRPSGGVASAASGTDVPDESTSYSLPSRKRDRDHRYTQREDGEAQRKSRRTTPTPTPGPSNSAIFSSPSGNGSDIDFIDLTGDDEVDAEFIAQQIREENRQKQENQDRELAVLLTRANEEWPDEPRPSQGSDTNAFSTLMSSQQLNTAPRQPREPSPFDVDEWDANRMPGAYNRSWDLSQAPASHGDGVLPGSRGFPPAYINETARGYPTNGDMSFASSYPTAPGRPGRAVTLSSYCRADSPANGNTDTLSSIINRTAGYDFANGINALNSQLPQRLTNYIQDTMHDTTVSNQELDDLLKNIRPDMDIPEQNRNGTPEGLRGTLYRHQELALAWLKQMEDGSNKGGILADDMGLGKTISMISLMIERKATTTPKTTLIVAPVALLRQWEEEIKNKLRSTHKLKTVIFHQKKMTTEELLQHDVVLTTYGTLAAEFKRLEKFKELNNERTVDYNNETIASKLPLLHPDKAKFHRVILDEAQAIKNKGTLTSKATHQVKSTYRWCLTGTPMMNGVIELYPLLRFLRIKPYCEWDRFRGAFGALITKKDKFNWNKEMRRLQTVLKAIMLRRKKNSKIDGQPILRLPPKSEEEVHVALSEDERDFYNQLEQKSQVVFNKYLRENTVGKNYSNILVLLLRLRQACCHPHLNLDVEDATGSTEDMSDLVKALDPAIVARIKEAEAFECPICYDAVQNPSFFVPCGHDSCTQCLSRIVDNAIANGIREGNETNSSKCPVCRGPFDPNKCFTYEAFLEVHNKKEEDGEEGDNASDSDSDESAEDSDSDEPDDVDEKGNLKGLIDYDGPGSDKDAKKGVKNEEDKSEVETMKKLKTKKKEKKRKKNKGKQRAEEVKPSMLKSLRKDAMKNRTAYKKYMAYLRKKWLPSAKVTECMSLLQRIKEESNGAEKTIIFSQWTLLLDLIEVAMHHEGFRKPERYDGGMSTSQRNDAACDFRSKEDSKVILVSLRAGNAGLNLTAASRVIMLDPFWNPYIEMQAVDRAYRIGQHREVKVYRILTVDTVEDRIVSLQQKKKEIVESALDENESRQIGRLSTNELRFLFNG